MNSTTEILDCGHAPSEHSESTTGYGIGADGKKRCYACMLKLAHEAMKDRSKPYGAYVSGDGQSITDWPGGHLMRVTRSEPCRLTRQSFIHDPGSYRSIHAVDVHGGHWYGRGSAGICITLRPCGTEAAR